MISSVKDKITKQTKKSYPNGIPAYGADALRFTFCSFASQSRQVRFDINRVDGYRNFCNKLWNAARFVLLCTKDDNGDFDDGAFQYSAADEWILSLLQKTIGSCHEHLANYRFDLLANELYEFVWYEYCDWYLELAKVVLFDETPHAPLKRGTRRTLVHVLSQVLKLLHPIIPFITEALWQRITKITSDNSETIMLCAYPQIEPHLIHPTAETEFEWVKAMIQAVRTLRSEIGISPAKPVPIILCHLDADLKQKVQQYQNILQTLGKISQIDVETEQDKQAVYASTLVGTLEILIPMSGLIDKQAELARLDKELAKLDKDIEYAQNKLNSSDFRDKAPTDLIASVEEKLQQTYLSVEKLRSHRANIAAIKES